VREIVTAREAYRRWAPSFDQPGNPILALETRHLTPLLPDVAGKRFLDIGCGTGRWLSWAMKRGARAAGVDLSPEMLREAAHKPGLAGRLVQADGSNTPFARACGDVVLCTLALGHMQPIAVAMDELAQLTAPGGWLFVTDFHPDALRHGWKRTFRAGVDVFEMESEPYDIRDMGNSRLQLDRFLELGFDEPERPMFAAAGKSALFDEVRLQPAILIASYRRL
jgi:SAM-dependent methyltransferase